MNRPVIRQPPGVAKQQQLRQLQSNRVLRGLRTGMELLEDKSVVAPIAMHEGLTDLKWILRGLLGGQFSLDLDPQEAADREPGPTASAKEIAATELDETSEGGNGEDKEEL